MFRRAVSRWPDPNEFQILAELLQNQRASLATARGSDEPSEPPTWTKPEVDRDAASRELAAWTLVAQTILNLDEVITRR